MAKYNGIFANIPTQTSGSALSGRISRPILNQHMEAAATKAVTFKELIAKAAKPASSFQKTQLTAVKITSLGGVKASPVAKEFN